MWLDAFNPKKSRDIENIVVPLVSLVSPAGNPMNMRVLSEPNGTVSENHFGSTGSTSPSPEPVELDVKMGFCSFVPVGPNIHAGFR